MNKFFYKYETLISILLIIIYIVVNAFCIQQFGIFNIKSMIANLFLSMLILLFIWKNKLFRYYGLVSFHEFRKYLYFVPLILIISINLWSGININNSFNEIMIYMVSMICVGFLEEIIFRGFLFQMMARDNVKSAIIVSSLTFGIGHSINLFNGALFISTMIQIICAIFIGYLFSSLVYKSKSIWPCIITHSCINALSIFSVDNNIMLYISSMFLIVISFWYSWYINNKV